MNSPRKKINWATLERPYVEALEALLVLEAGSSVTLYTSKTWKTMMRFYKRVWSLARILFGQGRVVAFTIQATEEGWRLIATKRDLPRGRMHQPIDGESSTSENQTQS